MLGCNSNDFSQQKGVGIMNVKVVSLEKCNATGLTISLVNEVAREMGVEIALEHAIVKTSEYAIEHRHIGNPATLWQAKFYISFSRNAGYIATVDIDNNSVHNRNTLIAG